MDLDAFCAQYDIRLNPQQRAAVLRDRGETLLLAVPGSGKTTVLISRTGYLVYCCGVPAENILCITYTKAAAEEMESRFLKKFGPKAGSPNFATINSLCVQILKYARASHGVPIPALQTSTRKLLRAAMKETRNVWLQDNTVQAVEMILTQSKNRMLSKEELEAIDCPELSEDCPGMTIAQFSALYRDYKNRYGCMDFDDQLLRAYRILRKFQDILEHFRTQYPHISLDEAQDTSPIQFAILEMLTQGASSFFVVGDDDQSIYAFRGADPQYILDFKTHYPQAEVLYLETNYRSAKRIVEAANRFIGGNRYRYAKTAQANSRLYGEIFIFERVSEKDVYEDVLRTLSDARETGETVAVLARNNYMLLPIAVSLDAMGIRTNRRYSFESYFTGRLIAGIVAALTLAAYPNRFSELRKARTILGLYLRNEKLDALEAACSARPDAPVLTVAQTLFAGEPKVLHRMMRTEVLLTEMAKWTPVNAVRYLRDKAEKQMHLDLDESFPMDMLELMAQGQETIPAFLEMLEQAQHGRGDSSSNITLTTIHSAKGLEFDRVILVDAFDKILPGEGSEDDMIEAADEEEDARLFYVAITRAKRRLDIYLPLYFGNQVVEPSPYLDRMFHEPAPEEPNWSVEDEAADQQAPAAENQAPGVTPAPPVKDIRSEGVPSAGDRIRHGILGTGTVMAVAGDILFVRFDSGAERTIAWCNWI